MKKTAFISIIILLIFSVAMFPENQPRPLKLVTPDGWPKPNDIFKDNPVTDVGFLLGKKLFYDGRLSKDGKFACASCHEPRAAFATLDHDFSHGFNGQFTTRNTPALQNLAWQSYYNWDGAFTELDKQAAFPITAPNEMAENIDSVLIKLRKDKEYPGLFTKVFGTRDIDEQRLLNALAQFTGMLVSADSKYDRMLKGTETFNPSELHGYKVFKVHCAECHKEPLFTDNSFRNNGLEADPYLNDSGRMKETGLPADSLKFRVPSLRNVALTQPYMHDGRFYSMQNVIDHYTAGIHQSATLDPLLREPMNLQPKEKYDLVQFLYTLTDSTFINNPAYLP